MSLLVSSRQYRRCTIDWSLKKKHSDELARFDGNLNLPYGNAYTRIVGHCQSFNIVQLQDAKAEKIKLYRGNQREIGEIRPKLLGDMGGYDFSIRKYTECARVTRCGDRGNSAFFVVDARTNDRELQLNISHN